MINWLKKYFCVGQQLDKSEIPNTNNERATRRKIIGIILPAISVNIVWWSYMLASSDLFQLFSGISTSTTFPRWVMSIVMIFGSIIAGATSEGGASVAFPFMTLALNIHPIVARDFSFMIQSVGMTAASFTILFMRLQLEWKTILWSSIGGVFGIIFGLQFISPIIPPPFSKIYFVTIWAAFAFQLYLLNRNYDRRVFLTIQNWDKQYMNWKVCVLLLTGFIGGIFSSIAGSGIDICCFSSLTLLFRISEKTATPTSVILMAINTCIGFFWRGSSSRWYRYRCLELFCGVYSNCGYRGSCRISYRKSCTPAGISFIYLCNRPDPINSRLSHYKTLD